MDYFSPDIHGHRGLRVVAQLFAQLFPQPPTWWPVFAVDQLNKATFLILQ
jgi:hypothetical protein